jgi:hypothetical protein
MQVIKYCRPEHNIRDGCETIRIGSFKYYRNMERTSPIADPDEGVHTSAIPGTIVASMAIPAR